NACVARSRKCSSAPSKTAKVNKVVKARDNKADKASKAADNKPVKVSRAKANKAVSKVAASKVATTPMPADASAAVSATGSAASSPKVFTSPTAAPAPSNPAIWSATRKRK